MKQKYIKLGILHLVYFLHDIMTTFIFINKFTIMSVVFFIITRKIHPFCISHLKKFLFSYKYVIEFWNN